MTDVKSITVDIPTDIDGYVMLKCKRCGTIFKLSKSDYEDERFLHIYCPSCGLTSDNYMTDDVLAMINAKVSNLTKAELSGILKNSLSSSSDLIRIEVSDDETYEHVCSSGPCLLGMQKAYFNCCQRSAKIKPLLKITGCYCPFCGVKNYEIE